MKHLEHLEHVITGGLMRKNIPAEAEEYLMEHGYLKKGVGGVMPTEAGYKLWYKKDSA